MSDFIKGRFLGQGFGTPEGTEILFKKIANGWVVIHDKNNRPLYILQEYFVEELKSQNEIPKEVKE